MVPTGLPDSQEIAGLQYDSPASLKVQHRSSTVSLYPSLTQGSLSIDLPRAQQLCSRPLIPSKASLLHIYSITGTSPSVAAPWKMLIACGISPVYTR